MIFPHHQKVLALYTLKDHLNTIQRGYQQHFGLDILLHGLQVMGLRFLNGFLPTRFMRLGPQQLFSTLPMDANTNI